jgi:hypothetical protein
MLTFEGARRVCHILEPASAFTLRIGSAGFETSIRHGTSLHAVVTQSLIRGLAREKAKRSLLPLAMYELIGQTSNNLESPCSMSGLHITVPNRYVAKGILSSLMTRRH